MPDQFILIATSDPGNATIEGTPLRLHPYDTSEDIKAALSWQKKGGHDLAKLFVASPDPDLPGVMKTEDGRPFLVKNEGWTTEAFARFLVNTWGHLA